MMKQSDVRALKEALDAKKIIYTNAELFQLVNNIRTRSVDAYFYFDNYEILVLRKSKPYKYDLYEMSKDKDTVSVYDDRTTTTTIVDLEVDDYLSILS
jgi:hypothetical protein